MAAFALLPVLASAQGAFQLPSGNIHCAVHEGTLRCDVMNFTYARPPRPPGCDLDWGGAVSLGGKGVVQVICHGDTVADPANPVLGYGQAWQGPGMACTAARTGLRCTNGDGRGFEMSRGRLRVF
ncbi:DUF6636 domain-containing protein [Neoroseomonas soli]|uniref:Uncharacterized protein n=1 Tax=Neoroseomonas soli TaxID=1081025 RepID=A0A9X9X1C9_9PROT|nr:DUF6636 domain-containing protein [Neoroseomonas soli]MBR0673208.1 hypothetical protein [Neoroseomonas soli]